MISMQDFMEAVQYKITGGSEYQWQCFGPNARYLDSDSTVLNEYSTTIVYDTVTQEVYIMEVWDYLNERAYRWINPDYLKAYKKEYKARDIEFQNACDTMDFTDLEVAEDILDKASCIVAGEEYDTRIQVPLDLPKESMHELMMQAHLHDMTLNEYVEAILVKAIEMADE
jgi:hypothetical protein